MNGQNTHIIVQDPEKLTQGKIELVFSNNPINLLGWIITNQSNQNTKIVLSELKEKIKIPLYLFSIIAEKSKQN